MFPTGSTRELPNPFFQEGNWYKSALHVHTTTSDGDVNMLERIAQYRSIGFDIVAITDHWKTNATEGLSDEKFLVINGMEAGPRSNTETNNHFVCLNLPTGYELKTGAEAQQAIDLVKADGGDVIYAHPYWSGHTIEDLLAVAGYVAIEVYNEYCQQSKAKGFANVHWDQLLNKGFMIPAVATDDAHHSENVGSGWTMIKAKELSCKEIMNALRTGSFYASCGPTIEGFRVENGVASIECSPVSEIRFVGQTYLGCRVCGKDGQLLTTAEWKLPEDENCRFVRMEVIDAKGNYAWANPITLP